MEEWLSQAGILGLIYEITEGFVCGPEKSGGRGPLSDCSRSLQNVRQFCKLRAKLEQYFFPIRFFGKPDQGPLQPPPILPEK